MPQRARRLLFAVLLLLGAIAPAAAQNDLSITAILQPESGCALTSTQNVTVRVFNYGNTLPAATSFNLTYTINAGIPVTELLVLSSPLLSKSALGYTFTTQANLSTPGAYDFDATVSLPGDVNPTNDAFTDQLVSSAAPSVGGVVSGPVAPTTSGTLTLSGQTGGVVEWQQSTDGSRWRALENTTATQPFSGLDRDTLFRAQVQSAPCAPALSNTVVVHATEEIFADGFES